MRLRKYIGYFATSFLIALTSLSSPFHLKGEESSSPNNAIEEDMEKDAEDPHASGEEVSSEAIIEYRIKDIMRALNEKMKILEAILNEHDDEIAPKEKIDQMIDLIISMQPSLIELIDMVPAKIIGLEYSDPSQFNVRKSEYQFFITKTLNYFIHLKHYFYVVASKDYQDEESYMKAHNLYFRKVIPLIKRSHFRFG